MRKSNMIMIAATVVLVSTTVIPASAVPRGGQNGGVVYACARKSSGALRVVDGPADCRSSEVSLALAAAPDSVGPKVLWGVVGPDGTLINGSGITEVLHAATGQYIVRFARSIFDCAVFAGIAENFTGSPDNFLFIIKSGTEVDVLTWGEGTPTVPVDIDFGITAICSPEGTP